jgi:hypothetical protein
MTVRDHDTGPTGVTVDQLVDRIFPVIDDLLGRLEGEEFTTIEFIELLVSTPGGAEAYDQVSVAWGEPERQTKMVIHGQVIPGAMRKSRKVEWASYAHGEADEFSVPAWWRLIPADE